MDNLIFKKLTRAKQLLDNLRSLKRSIVALPFMIVGEAIVSLEVLLESEVSCATDDMKSNQKIKAYSDVEERDIEPLLGANN